MGGNTFTDKQTGMQYRQDTNGDIWYRRMGGVWVKAGNVNNLQEAKLPLEVISLLSRWNLNRQRNN